MCIEVNSTFERLADSIADRGYAVIDQFLSNAEVQDILKSSELRDSQDDFRRAGIGKDQNRQINETIRGDYIRWIDNNSASPPVAVYLTKIQTLIEYLNRSLYLSLKDYEVHMTVYPPGAFYKRHLDQFNRDDHRKLSAICYLNNDWMEENGGQLRMFLPEGPVDLLPIAGRFVCFRSDMVEHEVLPATKPRLSLTGWILDQFISLKHL
jgi:SM-20-related protein